MTTIAYFRAIQEICNQLKIVLFLTLLLLLSLEEQFSFDLMVITLSDIYQSIK